MAIREIREPKQKRSIEKKNKIIQAGYELFCEKGYHNTNTAEIAKRAGVSTGIVYNYFNDKKGIFISVLDQFALKLYSTGFSNFQSNDGIFDLEFNIQKSIDAVLEMHMTFVSAHEEFLAMSHLDLEIKNYCKKYEEEICDMLATSLEDHGYTISNPHEKLHFVYDMVENFCHEVAYHKHECLDTSILRSIVVDSILYIINKP